MAVSRRSFLRGVLDLIGAGLVTGTPAARVIEIITRADPGLADRAQLLLTEVFGAEVTQGAVSPDASFDPQEIRIRFQDGFVRGDLEWAVDHTLPSIDVNASVVDNALVLQDFWRDRRTVSIEFRHEADSFTITGIVADVVYTPLGKNFIADLIMKGSSATIKLASWPVT